MTTTKENCYPAIHPWRTPCRGVERARHERIILDRSAPPPEATMTRWLNSECRFSETSMKLRLAEKKIGEGIRALPQESGCADLGTRRKISEKTRACEEDHPARRGGRAAGADIGSAPEATCPDSSLSRRCGDANRDSTRRCTVRVAVDAILVSPADVERYKDSHALVIKPALQEGRVVYEAA